MLESIGKKLPKPTNECKPPHSSKVDFSSLDINDKILESIGKKLPKPTNACKPPNSNVNI